MYRQTPFAEHESGCHRVVCGMSLKSYNFLATIEQIETIRRRASDARRDQLPAGPTRPISSGQGPRGTMTMTMTMTPPPSRNSTKSCYPFLHHYFIASKINARTTLSTQGVANVTPKLQTICKNSAPGRGPSKVSQNKQQIKLPDDLNL